MAWISPCSDPIRLKLATLLRSVAIGPWLEVDSRPSKHQGRWWWVNSWNSSALSPSVTIYLQLNNSWWSILLNHETGRSARFMLKPNQQFSYLEETVCFSVIDHAFKVYRPRYTSINMPQNRGNTKFQMCMPHELHLLLWIIDSSVVIINPTCLRNV